MATRSVSSTRDPNVTKKIKYVGAYLAPNRVVGDHLTHAPRLLLVRRFLLKFDKNNVPLDQPFPDAKGRSLANNERWDHLPQKGPKFPMSKHGEGINLSPTRMSSCCL
jgi:hypothetical protein